MSSLATSPSGPASEENCLCSRCRLLDLDDLFNAGFSTCHDHGDRRTQSLGRVSQLYATGVQQRPPCPFCRFLLTVWLSSEDRQVYDLELELVSRDWEERVGLDGRRRSAGGMALQSVDQGQRAEQLITFSPRLGSRFSGRRFRYPSSRERDTGKIDMEILKRWVDCCERWHGDECSPDPKIWTAGIPFFLIDVQSKSVVSAPAEGRYVALSYVWDQARMGMPEGSGDVPLQEPDESGARPLPDVLPLTIEDAIAVVLGLGERFLWVDAYCIDQTDTPERFLMIQNMDLVYAGAIATICAVSKPRTGSGLPGVSLPWRSRRPEIFQDSDSGTFSAIQIPFLKMGIATSRWNSRAWILQEAVLSKRRLCFHEDGIFLWCRRELFHDLFETHMSEDRVSTTVMQCAWSQYMPFEVELKPQWDFGDFNQLLLTYSQRGLTHDTDILHALAGILNRMSKLYLFEFTFGLPLRKNIGALLWRFEDFRVTRRPQFPSWSWLGWKAVVEYDHWVAPSSGLGKCLHRTDSSNGWVEGVKRPVVLDYRSQATMVFEVEPTTPWLNLKSQVASFQIRKWIPTAREREDMGMEADDGDFWELLNVHGGPIRVLHGPSAERSRVKRGRLLLSPDVVATFTETSPVLQFVCIESWKERWNGPNPPYGNAVTTLALRKLDEEGSYERVGVVAIELGDWDTAIPETTWVRLH